VYPQGVVDAEGVFYPQDIVDSQGNVHTQGYGYAPSFVQQQFASAPSYTYLFGMVNPIPEQRIVYVPYAAPPAIYVQRFGALPKPPSIRRLLGDANMYEYPEMPYQLYTTRGARDFLAPNPPGIGE
jgi:hypothetical protein